MANLWCLMFGHNWQEHSQFTLAETDTDYIYFCSRCGKYTGKLARSTMRGPDARVIDEPKLRLLLDIGVTQEGVLQFKDVPEQIINKMILKAYNAENVRCKAACVVAFLRRWQAAQHRVHPTAAGVPASANTSESGGG